MAKKAAFFLFLLCAGSLTRLVGQSATTYGKITYVDFAYGLPYYYGDFWKLGGGDVTYRGNPMVNQSQYNTSSVYAGAIIPINSRLYLRPQFSNSTIYFQSPFGSLRTFFRNNIFEAGLSAQFFVVRQRFGLYFFGGPSATVSYDAELFNSQAESESTAQGDRKIRIGLALGSGVQFHIWKRINIFAEYQFGFTGSDRFDGYNGDFLSGNGFVSAPDEKGYFKRDKIAVARAGIRLPITRAPSRIEERPKDAPLSTINPDPNFDEITLKQAEEKERRDKPALYYKLGVKKSLSQFTVAVSHVVSLEELERYNESASRVARELSSKNRSFEVLLMEEPTGYTVHFGTFRNAQDARQFAKRLAKHYRNVRVENHGK